MGFLTQGRREERKSLMDCKNKRTLSKQIFKVLSYVPQENNKWITNEKEARSKGNVKQKQSFALKYKFLHNKTLSQGLSASCSVQYEPFLMMTRK